jgi:hypothetical protein
MPHENIFRCRDGGGKYSGVINFRTSNKEGPETGARAADSDY